jgi:hypothetical protein
MYIYIYEHLYIYIYMCKHIYIYIYIYVCIYNLRSDNDGRDNLLVANAVKKQLEAEAIAEEALNAYRLEQQKRADLQVNNCKYLCID